MMWLYKYHIVFYDDIEYKMKSDCGIVAAETFAEAMTKIAGYFGENHIDEIEIKVIDNSQNGMMSKTDLEELFK